MRTLTTDAYTAAEVEAQLRSDNPVYQARFELLDRNLDVVDDISDYVLSATRTFDSTRAIKGSLALSMRPNDDLADALFRYRVKAWFGVRMGDGGFAEYPQGVYLWQQPDRDLDGVSAETWEVTLGDLSHVLDLTGPGLTPFQLTRGVELTTGIRNALLSAGFEDLSGVTPSEQTSTDTLTWSIRRNSVSRQTRTPRGRTTTQIKYNTTVTTWQDIVNQLCDGLGYYDVWFDPDGLPIAEPAANLQTATAEHTYATADDGIMLVPVQIERDPADIANRVFARSKSTQPAGGGNADAPLTVGVADANTILPGHPLSQAKIGLYVDLVVDNDVAATQQALDAQARKVLQERITSYERVTTPSLAWPAHEGYDLIGVTFDGDRDLDGGRLYLEDQFTLVLVAEKGTGQMTHRLRHIADVDEF